MAQLLRTVPWYDRNPKSVFKRYVATDVAPHALTERWSYTVPKGRKAFVEYLAASAVRITAAGPQGLVTACIDLGIPGPTALSLMAAQVMTNNVGDKDRVNIGQSLTLEAGDVLKASSTDLSTGGTMAYRLVAKITEFDAFPIERVPFQPELPERDLQEPR